MKITRKKKVLLFICLSLLLVCLIFNQLIQSLFFIGWSYVSKPDLKYVKEKVWMSGEGFRIGEGDVVEFNISDLFQLHEDTIFYKGLPRALVIRLNKHFHEMTVKSISDGALGTYVNTEYFLE